MKTTPRTFQRTISSTIAFVVIFFVVSSSFVTATSLSAKPAAIDDLTITRSSSDVVLDWSDVTLNTNGDPITIDSYNIYRSATDAYFPIISDNLYVEGLEVSTYTDSSVITGDDGRYYYAVTSVSGGVESLRSNRVGMIEYDANEGVPSGYIEIAIPLVIDTVTSCVTLYNYLGNNPSRISSYLEGTQSFNTCRPSLNINNFAMTTPFSYLYIQTGATPPDSYVLVGNVPEVGTVSDSVYTDVANRWNAITVPLDYTGGMTADDLAIDFGASALQIRYWNITNQDFVIWDSVGQTGTNFDIYPGMPIWVEVSPTGPASWPTYYSVSNLDALLDVVLADDLATSLTTGGIRGTHGLCVTKNNIKIACGEVSADENYDATNVTADFDLTTNKSVIYGTNEIGLASHTLYVPREATDNYVGICPLAQTIEDVTSTCPSLIVLTDEQAGVDTETIDGHSFWTIDFMISTGGFSITADDPMITVESVETTPDSATISGNATHELDTIAMVYVRVDGGDWEEADPTDGAYDEVDEDWSIVFDGLDLGDHTFDVFAVTLRGSISGVESGEFTVDRLQDTGFNVLGMIFLSGSLATVTFFVVRKQKK